MNDLLNFLGSFMSIGFTIAMVLSRFTSSDQIVSIMEGKNRNILNNAAFIIMIATLITYFSFATSYITNMCHLFIMLLTIAIVMVAFYFMVDKEIKSKVPLYCILIIFSCLFSFFLKTLSLHDLFQVGNDESFVVSDDIKKLLILWIINIVIAWGIIINFNALNIPVYIYRDGTAIGVVKSRVDNYILYECIKTNKKDNIIKNKLLPISELTKSNYYLSKKYIR